ncbi:MAG: MFS transporter, partial [Bacteroidota bacterium]
AMWAGEGGMLILAGYLAGENPDFHDYAAAWHWVFVVAALVFTGLTLYHRWALPRPLSDQAGDRKALSQEMLNSFVSFFQKPDIVLILAFLLLYRLGEAQLVKLAAPFLLDGPAAGGLSLSTTEVGWINGTVGVLALVAGGILGGVLASRQGLKAWFWPMVLAMNVPNLGYWLLATFAPVSSTWVTVAVAVEKFGYGFGFTAFLLYLLYVAQGKHQTAHYAIGTGFMALGMMLPGLVSGYIQAALGYDGFFFWVMLSTLPGMLIAFFVWRSLDPTFGQKKEKE